MSEQPAAGTEIRPTVMVPPPARGPLPVVLGLVFLVPALILLVTSFVEPTIWTIRTSFQRWNGLTAPTSVGSENYDGVINSEFWRSVGFALTIGLIPLGLALIVAPLLAWAAHRTRTAGRWVTRGLLSVPLAFFTPAGLALAWLVYRRPDLASPEAAKAGVLVAVALTLFGAVVAVSVTAYLAALRRRDPQRSPWPAVLVVAILAALGTFAVALQTFTFPWVMTEGGPLRSTQTPMLDVFDLGFRRDQFGAASAVSTVLLAVLAVLGVLATVLIIVTRLRLELDDSRRSADAAPVGAGAGPVALILGGILLLAVLAVSVYGHVPLLRGLFNENSAPAAQSEARIVANTYLPSFLSAAIGVLAAALAGFGIGALRPLGRWSELLLVPFAPFLFVGTGPLAIRGFARLWAAHRLETMLGLMSPILLVVPVLFVFALLGRGQAIRAEEIRQWGRQAPWARTYLLPALPMLAVAFVVTWLMQSQDFVWQLMVGVENAVTGPVAATRSADQFAFDASRIAVDLALPPVVVVLALLAAVAAQLFYLDRVALRVGRPEREGGPRT